MQKENATRTKPQSNEKIPDLIVKMVARFFSSNSAYLGGKTDKTFILKDIRIGMPFNPFVTRKMIKMKD